NTACCPSGVLSDCQNTGTGSLCKTGLYNCTAGAKTCAGATQKSIETCNGVDDDCNGPVDDVAGVGGACAGGGTNTSGTCKAQWKCSGGSGPGPARAVCTPSQRPVAGECDGLDNNCNG